VKSTVSIPPVSSAVASDSDRKRYVVAWLLCLIFYAMEYASRSSPSVMVPEVGKAFGTTAVAVAALLGTCYYTYSITSLIAGTSLDWVGARRAMPIGLLLFATSCLLFLVPSLGAGYGGRLCKGQARPLRLLALFIWLLTDCRRGGSAQRSELPSAWEWQAALPIPSSWDRCCSEA
jgi:MFS family permease